MPVRVFLMRCAVVPMSSACSLGSFFGTPLACDNDDACPTGADCNTVECSTFLDDFGLWPTCRLHDT